MSVDEILAGGEAAARVTRPNVFGENVDESRTPLYGNLVERLRGKHAVHTTFFKVVRHPRRRNLQDGDVRQRVDAVFRQEVAQQVVMHREPIGYSKGEPFHVSNVFDSDVLFRQR